MGSLKRRAIGDGEATGIKMTVVELFPTRRKTDLCAARPSVFECRWDARGTVCELKRSVEIFCFFR